MNHLAVPFEKQPNSRPRISPAALWVIFCAFCNFIGWTLSVLHQLNAVGYLVAFGLGLIALALWKRKSGAVFCETRDFARLRRRFSRAIPLGFFIVAGLAILGGVLNGPTNYDGLAYRTPRVLHWLAESRWHWIHTEFNRLNTRGAAYEWLTAPMFALLRTDRPEFLITAISFLLLPGRVFSIWTRLGVRPRVAWYWMWLFPTGYCYLTQAGSIANDLFGALLALAAIEFALRARESRRMGDLVVAVLAAGLMTSGKAFNLLLLLPWAVAAGPALWLLLKRPVVSAAAMLAAASVSLIPTAVLNYQYCGDWTGQKAENIVILGSSSPVLHVEINSILLVLHNFAPPVFPFSNSWEHLVKKTIPPAFSQRLLQNFEPGAARLEIPQMQMEEGAGLGLGVSALLLITLIYRWRFRAKRRISGSTVFARAFEVGWLVPLSAAAACAVFMTQSGLACPARYLAPFYPLLFAPLLAGDGSLLQLLRRRWWRCLSILVFALAALLVIISPARPLWPAVTTLKALGADKSPRPLVKRAWMVYSVYGDRANAFQPAVAILPPDASPLGIVTSDDPEGSLWRPFGSRSIKHVCFTDGADYLRQQNIKYVLVSSLIVTHQYQMTLDDWLKKYNAELVQTVTLSLRADRGPVQWWLVKAR
ncbi:MAG TPA: hypothetical protein VG938_18015 [Verrucomicrobiae bacterium]|nr:hypothetical protein [Verrucomicrobiae bacterium]